MNIVATKLQQASSQPSNRVNRLDDEDFDDANIIPTSIETSTESIHTFGVRFKIERKLIENIGNLGFVDFFPVQYAVIPHLIRNNTHACVHPRDICVSSPTGSGKTVAYVLPILNYLMQKPQPIKRLRALILLPSRELASQVFALTCRLSEGTGLRVALSTGQTSFCEEQLMLMGENAPIINATSRYAMDMSMDGMAKLPAEKRRRNLFSNQDLYEHSYPSTGVPSLVDVLICTPGRLLDHIQKTPGFTLRYLRFLVLDEADRLLANAYHGWMRSLLQSVNSMDAKTSSSFSGNGYHDLFDGNPPLQRLLFSATLTDNPRKLSLLGIKNPLIIRAALLSKSKGKSRLDKGQKKFTPSDDTNADAAGLDDNDQLDDTADQVRALSGFVLPSSLSESVCVCETSARPLLLAGLLMEACVPSTNLNVSSVGSGNDNGDTDETTDIIDEGEDAGAPKDSQSGSLRAALHKVCQEPSAMCLIFASSVEATHRLCRLLQLMNGLGLNGTKWSKTMKKRERKRTRAEANDETYEGSGSSPHLFGGEVLEMSRQMGNQQRAHVMALAHAGKVKILVASDQMARGIDLPNIKLVVNYDVPTHAKVYVHRAGRTARANRTGHCLTMLKKGQFGAFRKLRGNIGSTDGNKSQVDLGRHSKVKPTSAAVSMIEVTYNAALQHMPAILQLETQGQIQLSDSIPDDLQPDGRKDKPNEEALGLNV